MGVTNHKVNPSPTDVLAAITPQSHRFYLTRRQAEVLYWLSLGLPLTEVGHFMGGISYNTVKTITSRLYQRMQVKNAAEAVRLGFETGLLTARANAGVEGTIVDARRTNVPPRRVELRCDDGRQPAPEDQRLS